MSPLYLIKRQSQQSTNLITNSIQHYKNKKKFKIHFPTFSNMIAVSRFRSFSKQKKQTRNRFQISSIVI